MHNIYIYRFVGSLTSIMVCICLIIVMMGSSLFYIARDFNAFDTGQSKIYINYDIQLPSSTTEDEWADGLATLFRDSVAGISILMFIWYLIAIFSNTEIRQMRRKWWLIFIFCTVLSMAISLSFFWSYSTENTGINVLIFLWLFLSPLLIYFLSTLLCHREIKYVSPLYRLLVK